MIHNQAHCLGTAKTVGVKNVNLTVHLGIPTKLHGNPNASLRVQHYKKSIHKDKALNEDNKPQNPMRVCSTEGASPKVKQSGGLTKETQCLKTSITL